MRRDGGAADTRVTGFSTSPSSPSTNVEPNPYPGLVDFAVVGAKVVILSMLFADIPVDAATFDSIEAKGGRTGCMILGFDTAPDRRDGGQFGNTTGPGRLSC